MGGVVSAPFKAVSKIVDPITSIASSLPVVGPIAGPVAGYITGGPLGAAKAIAGSALTGGYSGGGGGGGGGSSGGAPTYGATDASGALAAPPPGFSFGSDLYSYGGEPYDASKYFVQGNKGVYNVLPELGNMYSPEAQGAQGTSGFNAYQNIYGKMAGDELAQANLQKSFSPGMLSVAPQSGAYKRLVILIQLLHLMLEQDQIYQVIYKKILSPHMGSINLKHKVVMLVTYLFSTLILGLEKKIKLMN